MSEEIRAIEIPPRRVLEMDRAYFEANYHHVNAQGEEVPMGEAPYLIVRYSDSKVFRIASFVPYGWQAKDCVYIEEL